MLLPLVKSTISPQLPIQQLILHLYTPCPPDTDQCSPASGMSCGSGRCCQFDIHTSSSGLGYCLNDDEDTGITYLPTIQHACLPYNMPAYHTTCLPTIQPACLPYNLPAYHTTYLPTIQPTCLPYNLPAYHTTCMPTIQPAWLLAI